MLKCGIYFVYSFMHQFWSKKNVHHKNYVCMQLVYKMYNDCMKNVSYISNHFEPLILHFQVFVQAILMSVTLHKKLNLHYIYFCLFVFCFCFCLFTKVLEFIWRNDVSNWVVPWQIIQGMIHLSLRFFSFFHYL